MRNQLESYIYDMRDKVSSESRPSFCFLFFPLSLLLLLTFLSHFNPFPFFMMSSTCRSYGTDEEKDADDQCSEDGEKVKDDCDTGSEDGCEEEELQGDHVDDDDDGGDDTMYA
jgi:hypothetical protein